MKLNPKFGKNPDELKEVPYKRVKALLKKDLVRLEKYTSAEKPTQVALRSEHPYPDKPSGIGMMVLGIWKQPLKDYFKKEVGKKDDDGAVGLAYYAGVGEDGQKIIRIDLAKGKAKNKIAKLAKGLRKLVPQSVYNLVFKEMDEAAFDRLDDQFDQMPEPEEPDTDYDVVDEEDDEDDVFGEVDPQNLDGLDLQLILDSNLKELSEAIKTISGDINGRVRSNSSTEDDADFLVDTLDLANEWLELFREAPSDIQQLGKNQESKTKVENIAQQVHTLLDLLEKRDILPTRTASAPNTTPVAVDTSYRAVDVGKKLHQNTKYWSEFLLTDGTKRVLSQQEYLQLKKEGKIVKSTKTWCNQLAYALSGELLGANSPFNFLPMGPGWTGANALYKFMEKADGVLVDSITGDGRYARAWEAINSGKMVYFCSFNTKGSGHVATGIPTTTLRFSKKAGDNIGRITQAGTSVGEFWIDEIWGSDGLRDLKIYVGKMPTPAAPGEQPDLNLLLAIYNPITIPVGKGKTPPGGIGKLSGKYDAPQLQEMLGCIRAVQQMLINSGDLAGKADGDCGDKTITAIESAQRKAGAEVTGFITAGDKTWNYLMGFSAGKIQAAKDKANGQNVQPANQVKPEQVQFKYAGGAKTLNAKADQILRQVLAKAGELQATVTSTLRSAQEQASIMYNNIIRDGAAKNRNAYKNPGLASQVVDAFEQAKSQGKSDADIQKAVLEAVNKVGADKLSGHCNASNPAVDIHPASLKNRGLFESILRADSRLSVVCPPQDPFYHIEFK